MAPRGLLAGEDFLAEGLLVLEDRLSECLVARAASRPNDHDGLVVLIEVRSGLEIRCGVDAVGLLEVSEETAEGHGLVGLQEASVRQSYRPVDGLGALRFDLRIAMTFGDVGGLFGLVCTSFAVGETGGQGAAGRCQRSASRDVKLLPPCTETFASRK